MWGWGYSNQIEAVAASTLLSPHGASYSQSPQFRAALNSLHRTQGLKCYEAMELCYVMKLCVKRWRSLVAYMCICEMCGDPRWMAARQEDCLCLHTEKVLCSRPLPSPRHAVALSLSLSLSLSASRRPTNNQSYGNRNKCTFCNTHTSLLRRKCAFVGIQSQWRRKPEPPWVFLLRFTL